MTEGLSFDLELKDLFSPSAARAEASLKKLEGEIRKADGELASFEKQLRLANELGDIAGHQKYSGLVEQTRSKLYGLSQQAESTKGSLGGLSEGAAYASVGLEALGPAAVLAGVAVVGALAEIGEALVSTGLKVSEFNERTVAAFDALGAQGEGSGKKTLAFLDEMAAKLPQSREELAKWTKQYEALGITDTRELRQQIVATASAQAIMGDEGAAAYHKITERVNLAIEAHSGLKLATKSLKTLYEAGVNEADIARQMGVSVQQLNAGLKAGTVDAQAFGNALSTTLVEKGAEPLRVASNEVGNLEKKIGEEFLHSFDGLDTTPISDALRDILTIGDSGEAAGKTLGDAVHDGAQKAINAMGEIITEATVLGINLETAWTKGMMYLDPVIAKMEEFKIVSSDAAINVRSFADGFSFAASVAAGAATGGVGGATAAIASHMLPANDVGGVVQPARGEMLASVAPGEMILPAPMVSRMASAEREGGGDTSQGARTDVGGIVIHITAPQGVTDAHQLSVTGLSVALERLQLASGH